jgi:hypothetical protein
MLQLVNSNLKPVRQQQVYWQQPVAGLVATYAAIEAPAGAMQFPQQRQQQQLSQQKQQQQLKLRPLDPLHLSAS